MNVQPMAMTAQAAFTALREYKAHRSVYDKRDWEIERIYRQIAKGKIVISVQDAIVRAGLDEKQRPRLAICEAHALECICNCVGDKATFGVADPARRWFNGGGKITVSWQQSGYFRGTARLPRIPPQHRPAAASMANYHLLWEADWTSVPRDPYLLRRIGKDAWVVLAAWDLTEVELSVLRAHAVLAMNGDVWRSATCEELAAGFQDLTKDEGHWRLWFNNPFMKIDMHDLVDRGFASWDGDRAIRFTDKGLHRMAKWVKSNTAQSLDQGGRLPAAGGKDSKAGAE